MAEENGLTVDLKAFEQERQKAVDTSRAAGRGSKGETLVKLDVHAIAKLDKEGVVGKTNDMFKYGKSKLSFLFGCSFLMTDGHRS